MAPRHTKVSQEEKALVGARLLRDRAVKSIADIHKFAIKVKTDISLKEQLDVRVRHLSALEKQFHDQQEIIVTALVELDRVDDFDKIDSLVTDEVENMCYDISAAALPVQNVNTSSPAVSASSNSHTLYSNMYTNMKLNFDGNITDWTTFRDTFDSIVSVDSNKIRRFHFLLSCLSDSALAIVKSIPITEANYDIAWTALTDRYENKRVLATAHLDKIFSYRPMLNESLSSLQTFLNVFKENIDAIKRLNVDDLSGFLLFYIASRVLDSTTRHLFESSISQNILPTMDELLNFVQQRCKILENLKGSSPPAARSLAKNMQSQKHSLITATPNSFEPSIQNRECSFCKKGTHPLYRCYTFQRLSVAKKREHVTATKLCFSCLRPNHVASSCPSNSTCKKCEKKHHTILHMDQMPSTSSSADKSNEPPPKFSGTSFAQSTVVLGTAVVRVRDNTGSYQRVRVLVDSGSQISAVTSACLSRLGLPRRKCLSEIVGLAQNRVNQIKGSSKCEFIPHHALEPVFVCNDLIVLSKITHLMPSTHLPPKVRECYKDLLFADPHFDSPGTIDMLLGGDIFPFAVRPKAEIIHTTGLPSALDTYLGWLLVGTVSLTNTTPQPLTSLAVTLTPSVDSLLRQFWTIEEPSAPSLPTTEDELCERWFSQTTSRDESGRFCVALPFKDDVIAARNNNTANVSVPTINHGLGESRNLALKRLYNLEQRLSKNTELYDAYRKFMDDYLSLGHMKPATRPGKYFIPHHAVVKQDGDLSKIRVVFDGSAPSSSGLSLNDVLCVGPKLQTDISDLLLMCRTRKFMFTADLVKMFRQVRIRDEDCVYQHILWRQSPEHEVQEFELLTVTYGLTSSPFLSIRCLHELDILEGHKFPAANGVLTNSTYVDDIIIGRDTEQQLLVTQDHLIGLLSTAGCTLKKWCSNSEELINLVPPEDRAQRLSFDIIDDSAVKVLGLHWDTHRDVFAYHTNINSKPNTKRGILSTIARLFDPIGALGPTILWAKCVMQRMWQEKLGWDDALPAHICDDWNQFVSELPLLRNVSLPRHIDIRNATEIQLLGFSDASQRAYAATSFLRVIYDSGKIAVFFIMCKTKVAPLKSSKRDVSLTIPRLELCAALLLSQLLAKIHSVLLPVVVISQIRAWTDSSIVLSWITTDQKYFKNFVTNRVAKIHQLLPVCNWSHVNTADNAADPSSRGLLPAAMTQCSIHWNGPAFLKLPESQWPQSTWQVIPSQELPEATTSSKSSLVISKSADNDQLLLRFSSLTKMQRTIALIMRFRNLASGRHTSSASLTRSELDESLLAAVRITQRTYFSALLRQLRSPLAAITPPTLAQLAPFLDDQGVIRVGGRLRYASVSYDMKHPILLPKSSHLSTLLIRHYHLSFLHGGPKLILAMLSRKFWILSGRDAVRRFIYTCVTCTRMRASRPAPVMGDLPPARVELHRPFTHVGMDYGGPFMVKESRRRNAKTSKTYLALFICMSVKAVHLEVVSDLTTDAFLAALDRFVARRGIPSNIYSDCGTNYVGAARQLKALFDDPDLRMQASNRVASTWHFNPPAAPHFGGLWEAAIKSSKHHLRHVIGDQIFTIEELTTLVARVEGILNSRPLTQISSDPNDLCPLTPGHFLIGQPLLALPETNLGNVPLNRLDRWQLVRQCYQSFWKRWTTEYLSTLQGRGKWFKPTPNLEVGDLVIVEAPNQPPTYWKMGRITAVHPGKDNVVRVATVKTQDGDFKRPVVKLVKLPVHDSHARS